MAFRSSQKYREDKSSKKYRGLSLKKGEKLYKFKDEEKSLSLIFEKFPEKDIFLRGGQLW